MMSWHRTQLAQLLLITVLLSILTAVFPGPLGHWATGPLPAVFASQLPSLFRGVVVADHVLGVRVISVEEFSQGQLADLRPEDIIMQVNGTPVRSIDEFAVLSQSLKGTALKATVLLLRHGQPREILLHLYSYPVLRHWDLAFVPEHDVRFADPHAGREYWMRMGRGFEIAHHVELALNAYLNALHNDPTQVDVALKVSDLLWSIAQARLDAKQLPEALTALEQGTRLMHRLFDEPLQAEALERMKVQLQHTVTLLKAFREPS